MGHDGTNIFHFEEQNEVARRTVFSGGSLDVYSVGRGGRGIFEFGFNIGVSGSSGALGGFGITGYGGTGVFGRGAAGEGVRGVGEGGSIGVYGSSDDGTGVYGVSQTGGGVIASGTPALFADGRGNPGPSSAGYFFGNVRITGNLTVGGSKSAVVPHPDGSHRQLYVLESPESWFEDFGEALLENGRAEVDIDPDFAALVQADGYKVFLTPYGDCLGLYVSNRRPSSFSVREIQNGTSNIAFGYRVLARRKDVEVERLARVEIPERPALREPSELSPSPSLPEPPAKLDLPPGAVGKASP